MLPPPAVSGRIFIPFPICCFSTGQIHVINEKIAHIRIILTTVPASSFHSTEKSRLHAAPGEMFRHIPADIVILSPGTLYAEADRTDVWILPETAWEMCAAPAGVTVEKSRQFSGFCQYTGFRDMDVPERCFYARDGE